MIPNDFDTRSRLLDTATRLFAQQGLKNVTVRAICDESRANVASVSYHFGSKHGLYLAVIESAVDTMRSLDTEARQAGVGGSAEQQLRVYIRVFLNRLAILGCDSWIHQLIRREFSEPTAALERLIEKGLRPRFEYLGGIVGSLLGRSPDDPRVLKCILSIQSQVLMLMPSPAFTRVYAKFGRTPPTVDDLVEHIADFSLGGIRVLAAESTRRPSGRHSQRKPSQ